MEYEGSLTAWRTVGKNVSTKIINFTKPVSIYLIYLVFETPVPTDDVEITMILNGKEVLSSGLETLYNYRQADRFTVAGSTVYKLNDIKAESIGTPYKVERAKIILKNNMSNPIRYRKYVIYEEIGGEER